MIPLIIYACNNKNKFWILNKDGSGKFSLEEIEYLLYEEGSILINDIKGLSSTTHTN